jgi:hypothetical protein
MNRINKMMSILECSGKQSATELFPSSTLHSLIVRKVDREYAKTQRSKVRCTGFLS